MLIRTKIKHVKLNMFLKATTAMMSISLSRSSSTLMANGAPEEVEINRAMFSFPSVGKLRFHWSLSSDQIKPRLVSELLMRQMQGAKNGID